ncbi:uncharacterized protein LOC125197190 [Salvia hispanica]|uniref:uncharacterized protein LOC125197190 n=1 Tax=Salvia hispanica TaxID=49212 RepID=UPI002009A216|nr:uncharacterized protein LOC125197190 [Salvia hispanica]
MVEEIESEEEAAAAPARSTPFVAAEGQGITKMKFSLYYAEEEEDFGGDDGGGEREECGGGAAFGGDWEGVIAMRMGDMGWYRWQDRTVLSGNVVRLWEGRRRRRHAAAEAVDGGFVW